MNSHDPEIQPHLLPSRAWEYVSREYSPAAAGDVDGHEVSLVHRSLFSHPKELPSTVRVLERAYKKYLSLVRHLQRRVECSLKSRLLEVSSPVKTSIEIGRLPRRMQECFFFLFLLFSFFLPFWQQTRAWRGKEGNGGTVNSYEYVQKFSVFFKLLARGGDFHWTRTDRDLSG
jgi:hypothetical protein